MSNAPASMMERILHLMAEKKASDVYLSPRAPATIKINGEYLPINSQPLPVDGPMNLLLDIVPPNRIEELKETGELNTAIPLHGVGNFRLSAMRQRGMYAAVIRFISPDIPPLHTLNLPDVLRTLVLEKRGLILMVGATGAGKSTTLAAMLDHRNENMTGHILTIEDPLEYMFTNKKSIVNQREVGSDTASLQIGLKNALRQAPDVIMIGEIRDRETMDYALAFAETGHLCMATLHANNSNQALDRIINFFPEERRTQLLNDLSLNLKGFISQRLIPRKGEKGRVAAVEILLNSPLISELILKGDIHGVKEIMAKSRDIGMQTFDQALFDLYEEDLITYDDALKNADSVNDLRLQIQLNSKKTATAGSGSALDNLALTDYSAGE